MSAASLRAAAAANLGRVRDYGSKQVSFVKQAQPLLAVMLGQALVALLIAYPGLLFAAGTETENKDWGIIVLRFLLICAAFYATSGFAAAACRQLPPADAAAA